MVVPSFFGFRGALATACRTLAAVFLTGVLLSGKAAAQAQDFEGKSVTAVDFRYESEATVDEARLRNNIQLSSGSTYSTDTVDNDIKALYESGLVDDVRVLAEPIGEDSVRVVYAVVTRSEIVGVGFAGNAAFSDTKLAGETELEAGGALSDQAILNARNNLEDFYEEAGYPYVSITHRVQPAATGRGSELIFVVDEGEKNEINDIRFEGNETFDDRTLRRQMDIEEKGILSWFTNSGRFEVDQLDEDLESVLDYYRTNGYLRASSPGVRREPAGDGQVNLVIPINEGEKYTVNSVGFGRMSVFSPEELRPALTLNDGDAYNSKRMRADMTTIRSYYGSRGYADAEVVPDIRDAGPNQVDVVYEVTEGDRFRVGAVNIEGNTKTQDRVIRREVPLNPDDHFNSVELETTKSRLEGLQYFNTVEVNSSPSARSGNYRDVDILVSERRTGSITAGVGFSSIDNVVGFVNLEQSNFDVTNPWNFTGGGQRFAMDLRLGSERADFGVSLTEPWFMGRQLALTGELFYRNSQYYSDFYEQTNAGAAVSIRKPLSELTYLTAEYRLEQVEVDLENSVSTLSAASVAGGGPPSRLLQEQGDYVRSALSANWVYDSRDAVIETRTGSKVDIGASVTGTFLGGDVDTFGMTARGSKYWNLSWDSILSVQGELAFVDATSGSVPIFDRLYLGGARTLRGFEFRDVGPRDPVTGEVFGGKSLGFMSVEYTVPIINNVRAAAFYDLGFVNNDSWDPDPSNLYHDVGLGIRLKLPVSPVPIALDYAVPVESPDPAADQGGRFNFSLSYEY